MEVASALLRMIGSSSGEDSRVAVPLCIRFSESPTRGTATVFSLDVELEAASEKLCNRFTTLGQDRLPLMEGKILVPEALCGSAYCRWPLMAAAFGEMWGLGGTDSTGGYSRPGGQADLYLLSQK
jgi:hypothetical protein